MMEPAAAKESLAKLNGQPVLVYAFSPDRGCGRTNFPQCGNDVKQFTYRRRLLFYPDANKTAFPGENHEDATIGILVVQVRHIRTIFRDVFQRTACAAFVTG